MSELKFGHTESNATKPPLKRVRRVIMPNPLPKGASTDLLLPGLAEFLQREDHAAVIGDDLVERYVDAFVEWMEEGDSAKGERLAKHMVTCMDAGNVVVVRAVMQASLKVHARTDAAGSPAKPAKTSGKSGKTAVDPPKTTVDLPKTTVDPPKPPSPHRHPEKRTAPASLPDIDTPDKKKKAAMDDAKVVTVDPEKSQAKDGAAAKDR